jgi:TPP-dependent pyruvate/acetoin dehydrogenase alpha subunit
MKEGMLTEGEAQRRAHAVDREIEEAVRRAKASPYPPPVELLRDVH